MNSQNINNIDDVGEAIREGRELRPANAYRILFAQENLDFHAIEINDPVPLGRQILIAAGLRVNDGYSLFAILQTGDFEDLRLDEPFDLRGRGAERFVAFQTDRDYKLTVNDSQLSWGKPAISGAALYELAKPADEPNEAVDLTTPGIEHFITAPKRKPKIDIVVNGREVQVSDSHQTFEQFVAIAYPGEAPTAEIVYSITYRGAHSKPHSGELAAGAYINVKNGSVINVGRTIQS
jgi:hypothetical protein